MFNSASLDSTDQDGEGAKDGDIDDIEYKEYSNTDKSNTDYQSSSSSSESNSMKDEGNTEFNDRYFYIDKYDNDQLKQLIKLFMLKVNSDTKSIPEAKSRMSINELAFVIPENLWIEKQTSNNEKEDSPRYDQNNFENRQISDFIEDSLDANNDIWMKGSK